MVRFQTVRCALAGSSSTSLKPFTWSPCGRSQTSVRSAALYWTTSLTSSCRPRFTLLKRSVMTSSAVLTQTIADSQADRVDFHPTLQPGGGRFRHFAMNAAAAEYYPPWLVDVAARAVGYDVPWRNDPSGDTNADLAANRIGRDFTRFLQENAVGELSANAGVQRWVTARFKSG